LPVDAQATTLAPRASARVTPIALARSLNEPVGLRPSSFTRSARSPAQCASSGASTSGVPPGTSAGLRPLAETGSSSA
jgi:hypothetical protein